MKLQSLRLRAVLGCFWAEGFVTVFDCDELFIYVEQFIIHMKSPYWQMKQKLLITEKNKKSYYKVPDLRKGAFQKRRSLILTL